MTATASEPLRITVDAELSVSGLLQVPHDAVACFVFAHGAGAGMEHAFMASFAAGLAAHGVATLRYQFPFMERKSSRVDAPQLAHTTVRAAVAEAARRLPGLRLWAGGKSFGGRMTSQAQADQPLPGVCGLVFIGFPLHPAGKPGNQRGEHLASVQLPMLFLQGTRDELADLTLLRPVVERLGKRASLQTFDDADHAFHVRKQSGSTDAAVLLAMCAATAAWARITPPMQA